MADEDAFQQQTAPIGYASEQEQQTAPDIKTYQKDGRQRATVDMEYPQLMQVLKMLKTGSDAVDAMNKRVAFLQQQEERVRANPILNVLTTIGGNLAVADKRLPPVVQALGRSSLMLNPTPDELARQRMELTEQAGELALKTGGLGVAQERTMFDTRQAKMLQDRVIAQNKAAADYIKELRISGRESGKPISYEDFYAGGVIRDIPPEKIPLAYKQYVAEMAGVATGIAGKQQRAMEIKDFAHQLALDLEGVKQRNRIGVVQKRFENTVSETEAEFQLKLHEQKKAIDEAASGRKELTVLGPPATKTLTQASATNQYIGTVEHMMEQPEWAEVQGPLFQYDPAKNEVTFNPQAVLPKQFKNIDRTVVESQIAHEIPRLLTILLNSQAGGASILRIEAGQKLIRDMGITGQVRPDQALAIMKIVRDTNNNNIAAVMRSKRYADWPAMRDLLGVDDPRNKRYFYDRKDAFGGPIQPFPSFERRETDKKPKSEEDDPLGIR